MTADRTAVRETTCTIFAVRADGGGSQTGLRKSTGADVGDAAGNIDGSKLCTPGKGIIVDAHHRLAPQCGRNDQIGHGRAAGVAVDHYAAAVSFILPVDIGAGRLRFGSSFRLNGRCGGRCRG